MDQKAIYNLTYGLFVLTARDWNKDNGCIINTAAQITSSPNRISIAVNKSNLTHDMILKDGRFNLSVLDERAGFEIFRRFGFQSGRAIDKFDGFSEYKRNSDGLIYITEGTNSFISGAVEKHIDVGSHTLFIASVSDMEVLSSYPSATYAYYQANIKPNSETEKKVPDGKTVWRCKVCGYIYEGEELPSDFICPWCKHPASDFEKVIM